MLSKIETVKINFPKNCLRQLLNKLIHNNIWGFAKDNKVQNKEIFTDLLIENKMLDKGFFYNTFSRSHNINDTKTDLNIYANMIFEMIKEKCTLHKLFQIERVYWNYYHPNSQTDFHTDTLNPNNISIVYNLHSNSGGTLFIDNNGQEKKIKAEENEAIVFPSNIKHRGLGPTQEVCRFSLNMIVV